MNIRKRIFIPMILLTIGCSVAVLVFSVLLYNREINSAMYDKVSVAATVAEHEINTIKARAFIAALGMANNPNLIDALVTSDHEKIVSTAVTLHTVAQLDYCTILDGEGIVLTRTHAPGSYGDSIAHLPHIRSALAGEVEAHIIQGPIVRLGVSGGAPVHDEDGKTIGLVSLGFRLDTQRFAHNLKALTGCEIAFFLGNERVSTTLLNPDGSYALGTRAPDGVFERVLGGEVYIGRTQLIGRDAITKFTPIFDVNNEAIGMIGIGYYIADYIRKIQLFFLSGTLITLALLVVCILLANYISKTVERRLENMMDVIREAKELAEHSSRAKSEFLSRMSHEMRTPMNAIMGMMQLVKMKGVPDKVKNYFDEIGSASNQLLRHIDDVLDISGMEYGIFKLSDSVFNFRAMSRDVLQTAGHKASEKQQTLTFNIDPSIPASVKGDEKRLKQVITNLLANAVKFSPEHGKICFNANVYEKDNETITLQIEVIDNGIGISKEQHNKLFDIFEQVHGGSGRKHGGIGVGLALSRRIIEMMDGDIWVESEPDKGAKFVFTCKLKDAP